MHVAPPGGLGLAAIETDARDAGVGQEEFGKIIDYDRFIVDRGIEAALPDAASDHVPERNAGRRERCLAARVGRLWIKAADHPENRPEMIARVRVVLPRSKRGITRHAAKNQQACRCARNRW